MPQAMLMNALKKLIRKLPPKVYYNILTSHDVVQAASWRRLAPAVSDEAFRDRYRMLFVLGCGRSGTTIFSRCVGRHGKIVELNEPMHIWCAIDMKTDIVSPFAGLLGGRCRFDRHDARDKAKARYRAMFDYHVQGRAPVICDKLPINTFRVDYIEALHPNAKFIHLTRAPRAVAWSIEECVKRDGVWWGFNDYKWRTIRRYAESRPDLRDILPHAIDDYYRGLIEWRVGQELVRDDLAKLSPEQYWEVDYDDFIADPETVLTKAFDFAGLPSDQGAIDFAKARVAPTDNDGDSLRRSQEDEKRHKLILGEYFHWGHQAKVKDASSKEDSSAVEQKIA